MNWKRLLIFVTAWVGLLRLVPAAWAQTAPVPGVTVTISQESAVLMAGTWVEFTTSLHNEGSVATPRLAAHLSIAATDRGRHVDPEDWLPQMTQYVPPIQPGETTQLNWRLHALFEGQFAAFVTVLNADAASVPVVSPTLRLQVSPDNILPLSQVIPVAAVVPLFPLALLLWNILRPRRRPPLAS